MLWKSLDPMSQMIFLHLQKHLEECIKHTHPQHDYYFENQHETSFFMTQIPFPLMNGIISFTSSPDEIEAIVLSSKQRFRGLNYPITWYWPHDEDAPTRVVNLFSQHSFQPIGRLSSIGGEADSIRKTPLSLPKFASIKRVETKEEFAAFIRIMIDVYGIPPQAVQHVARFYGAYQFTSDARPYLGFFKQQPVAILFAHQMGDVIALFKGGTLQSYRKHGFLTNLIIHAIRDLSEAKYVATHLMPTKNAIGIYDRFGYKTYAHFTPYCTHLNTTDKRT